MPHDEETITTTAAERRLGGALMWTGVLLGAMFIAVLGLGFMVYSTSYAPTGPLQTLTATNKDLQAKLDAKTEALRNLQERVVAVQKENEDLKAAAAKKPVSGGKKPVVNPY